ncbi:amidase, putative [Bodo saltans]|uniref:Amidase, putative n=1 Tax=Bodo saltans TaxID=75058 RepID=A0A0S4JCI1_BODSA|nr:amidase, putative [Bodo saltans]|eukprot:CUG87932.1 amidase, putative [Bodo saltans]
MTIGSIDLVSFGLGVGCVIVFPVFKSVVSGVVRYVRCKVARAGFAPIRSQKRNALGKLVEQSDAWAQLHMPTGQRQRSAQDLIASKPLSALQNALETQQFTAKEILAVFLANSLHAHRETNCLSWIMLESAIEAANRADSIFTLPPGKTRQEAIALQPLLGVPFSIKEMLAYRDTDCTLGLTSRAKQPVSDTSSAVLVLERQGAIAFVKTSVPVLLMSYECESDLFGTTTNPYHNRRTCGGSSGGEGALLALNGSAFGLGTDIGGSIRIPSAFCGIVGFKPTFLRVSSRGNRAIRGDESIPTITGPMGRRVADVTDAFKCLTTPVDDLFQQVDGMCGQVPFRSELHESVLAKKILRVGYYMSKIPPCVEETISCFYELLGADGTKKLRALLGFDIPHGVVGPLLAFSALPSFLKDIAAIAIRQKVDATFAKILSRAREKQVHEYGDTLVRRNNCRNAYADLFSSLKLDAVVGPGFYIPAPACGSSTDLSFGASATAYYNCLDLPVLALPVTKVKKELDVWTTQPSNGMSRCIKAVYDHEDMNDLPVGIQIVTPKFTEEVTLAVGARLEGLLRGGI